MAVPEHFHRFWRRLDDQLGRVETTWWGAVVTDPRFPAISDANYARIDTPADLTAADVEATLLPAIAKTGARTMHAVSFHPDATEGLFAELAARGHHRSCDLVMDRSGDPPPAPDDIIVKEPDLDAAFWARVEASFALFGVEPREAAVQLLELERTLERSGVKRWFTVQDGDGTPVSMAALILLEDVGYVDNVCTFPQARGRGFASAVTIRAVREARDAGAQHVTLLADPPAAAVIRIYERLGFERAGLIEATRGPVPELLGHG